MRALALWLALAAPVHAADLLYRFELEGTLHTLPVTAEVDVFDDATWTIDYRTADGGTRLRTAGDWLRLPGECLRFRTPYADSTITVCPAGRRNLAIESTNADITIERMRLKPGWATHARRDGAWDALLERLTE